MRLELLACVGLAAFAIVCLHPVLGAQFVLVDDHEILSFTQSADSLPLQRFGNLVVAADPGAGRVRPMYWLTRLGEMSLLRDNPTAWHAVVVGVGLACAVLLYSIARQLGFNRVLALLLGAWLLVAPGVSSVWVRLGPNETFGMLFLGIAAFAAVKAASARGPAAIVWDSGFVIASIATFLSKESLILLAPALALFRVMVGTRQKCPRSSRLPAVCVLAIGLGLGVVAGLVGRAAGTDSYGGEYLAPRDAQAIVIRAMHNLAILLFAGVGWLLLLLLPALRRWRPSRGDWGGALLVLAVVGLVVLPQVALYSNVGILEGRYELPAAIGIAGLVAAALRLLYEAGSSWAYRLGIGLFTASVLGFGVSTWSYANYFAADSQALHRLVVAVTAETAPDEFVAIAGDPARQFEPIFGLASYLAYFGRTDAQIKLLPLQPTDTAYSRAEANLAHQMDTSSLMAAPTLDELGCANLGAVVILRDDSHAQGALPCLATGFQREEFTAWVPLWGGEGVSLRPRWPGMAKITYLALVTERRPG